MGILYNLTYDLGVGLIRLYSKHDIEVRGEKIPDKAIIASTHSSLADGPVLNLGLNRRIIFLSKFRILSAGFQKNRI